jgi:hypothetical protein
LGLFRLLPNMLGKILPGIPEGDIQLAARGELTVQPPKK